MKSNHLAFIKRTDVGLLSRGNVLCRFYEEEELASVASSRILMWKHFELNLEAFWTIIEHEYLATAKNYVIFGSVSTSYSCEHGFSAMTTTKPRRERILFVIDELRVCLSKTLP
ncbi:hypothetical protein RF11_03664 [Thelohanellus kitauei]|uniref:HAT C-terminal dimerisation domain-containing protein n=1 Tax=Thelohanellus kitauei TaxID=669202 RepID=A0A0C2JSM3_THEKT|nr:hypothetical protein RF11_03664 [Thelohanellus kitauei]